MIVWRHWARGVLALTGIGCAVAIYVYYGHRPSGKIPPVVPPADPTTTSVMGEGDFERRKDGKPSFRMLYKGRTTFSDDRVRLTTAHIQSFDERGLEMWGDAVDTNGKALQSDNPAEFTLTGHVRFHTKDGLDAWMDTATYNDLSGVLIAPGHVTFTKGRMNGEGEGARYQKHEDLLILLDHARVKMAPDAAGNGAFDATTHQLTLDRPHDVALLERDARIVRDGDTLTGDTAIVHSTEDQNHVTRIELHGHARVLPAPEAAAAKPATGSGPPDMQADDIDLALREDGQTIRQSTLVARTGVASVDMTDADGAHRIVKGSRVNIDLAPDGQTLTAIDAARPVTVVLPKTADAGAREITADTLKAVGAAPEGLKSADFDIGVRFVEHVAPAAGATVESLRTMTSEHLTLLLNGQLDAISHARFTTRVTLEDKDGKAGADKADYDPDKDIMLLTQAPGSRDIPWAHKTDADQDRRVEARSIDLFLDNSNNLNAAGAVRTISQQKSKPAAGHAASPIFAGDGPIRGMGETLRFVGTKATYTGAPGRRAELKQDTSRVTGDTVVFDSETNDLSADGHVESNIVGSTTYDVTNADSLLYVDADRVAHFKGKPVKLTSTDGITTARTADLEFAKDSREIEHMTFEENVKADLSGRRRGIGRKLTYDAATEKYVLTGTAEVLSPASSAPDSLCTLMQGDRIVFERVGNTADGAMRTLNDIPCNEPLPYKAKAKTGDMATLRTEGLTKSYGGRTVVRNINLDVASGEIVGLLGPNGAGKTTTFSMVVGLTGADAGRVLLDDQPVTADPMYVRARKGIGYLPQESSIFRGMTVEKNILAILETQPIGAAERRTRLTALLAELNLTPLARSRAHTLSGGERRRVEITRALVSQPKFMLLDEPFAGIDPIAVGDIQKIIFHLRDRGIGVLITDHNVRETLKITDRAYIVHDGAIFRQGTPARLAADDEVKRIYLGADFRLD